MSSRATWSGYEAKWRTAKVGKSLLTLLMAMTFLGTLSNSLTQGEEESKEDSTTENRSSQSWTSEEALAQLRLYPRDPYLQYVAVQLALREDRLEEIAPQLRMLLGRGFGPAGRANQVDLFSIFSGASAVQESLQLDTMIGEEQVGHPDLEEDFEGFRGRLPDRSTRENLERQKKQAEQRRTEKVQIDSLTGPTISSHPWKEMLGDQKPEISSLAKSVPVDFYYVEFQSVNKLLQILDSTDLWSTHLINQSVQEARTELVGDRIKRQLLLETNPLVQPFYDLVVERIAVTGSDLFYREGSDLTLIFHFRQPEIFKARLDGFIKSAIENDKSLKLSTDSYLGIEYQQVTSPDRSVHLFSAYPAPGLHVRSNSLVGLQRVLETIQGKDTDGNVVQRLGETDEFAYIRTLMPQGASDEDGFVYLSDPFIRHLVGSQLKLTARRRMLCYNHLRMINHAALLYRTEQGKNATSLEDLTIAGCTPGEFGIGKLTCPDGGKYALSEDGMTGVCSHHGHAHSLTPCCEIPLEEVSGTEADQYKSFLDDYNQYWRTYFDPIALKIQATPQQYRIETIVLPLIDNSLYTGLAYMLGGPPESLESLPVPERNIFSLNLHLNKEVLLSQSGLDQYLQESEQTVEEKTKKEEQRKTVNSLKQIAIAFHSYHDIASHFYPSANFSEKDKKPLLSWRVHMLPFMGEQKLYEEFHLDEPWDSEHNKQLIAKIPKIFQPDNAELIKEGKTRLVGPLGERAFFSGKDQKLRFRDFTDGVSNTVMIVEADDKHAVIWTKPDDLAIDLEKAHAGLHKHSPGGYQMLFVDGSVHFIRDTISNETLAAFFTRNGDEEFTGDDFEEIPHESDQRSRQSGFLFSLAGEDVDPRKMAAFLKEGIGSHVGIHVYDADPMFDFSLPNFAGSLLGTFNPGRQGRLGFLGGIDETLGISIVISSLNTPTYISIPVQNTTAVDEFLDELDLFLARIARIPQQEDFFFSVQQDFYQLQLGEDNFARGYSFRVGPIKWRLFWGRIGNGLYIASKPFILEDLLALERNQETTGSKPAETPAHGMVRIRPKHWSKVLDSYQLGWEENNRQACLHNVGILTSLSRSLTNEERNQSEEEVEKRIHKLSEQIYDTHFFCPDEGHYHIAEDGKKAWCSLHGSALSPKQKPTPSSQSELAKLIREFSNMTLTLTFLEDGLHAVMKIERK
ncbi:MAG: DUF1559 domain-containing protein [Planctomycetaceae bacterium]|nr:DUF1559 domain-containing protein [Planctomycetaceae bacterium]